MVSMATIPRPKLHVLYPKRQQLQPGAHYPERATPIISLCHGVFTDLAPVVQKVDSAIHRINHYPADSTVGFTNAYPVDSDLSGG